LDTSSDIAIVDNDNDRGGEGSENNKEIPELINAENDSDEEPVIINIGNDMSERPLSPSTLTYMDEQAIITEQVRTDMVDPDPDPDRNHG